jgi:exosome complex component RRP4
MSKEMIKNEKDFVVPGDEIVKSMDYLPGKNTFREGDSIFAKKLGVVCLSGRVVSVIPLSGVYAPKIGDMVLGEVVDIQSNGWVVEINSFCQGYLPLSGVRDYIDTNKTSLSSVYAMGDLIYAKISAMNPSSDSVYLSMQDSRSRKFTSGRIVRISPSKVPRLIGKMGSMINVIKDNTGCRISVGQNGLVWLDGENIELALQAVKMIEENAHKVSGLTDKVSDFLSGKKK